MSKPRTPPSKLQLEYMIKHKIPFPDWCTRREAFLLIRHHKGVRTGGVSVGQLVECVATRFKGTVFSIGPDGSLAVEANSGDIKRLYVNSVKVVV